MNTADELAKLAQLRDQGVLSEEEFQQQKQAVLSGAPSAPVAPAAAPPKAKGGALKGCLIVVVILVVLAVVGAIVGGGGKSGSSASTAPAASTPPIEVTATDLFNAFHANEPAAQNQYGDHPLLVSGTVESVDLDFKNDAVLKLKTPNEFMSAQAELTDAAKGKASSISKGQQVKLLCGNVKLILGTPMLSDCDPQ